MPDEFEAAQPPIAPPQPDPIEQFNLQQLFALCGNCREMKVRVILLRQSGYAVPEAMRKFLYDEYLGLAALFTPPKEDPNVPAS